MPDRKTLLRTQAYATRNAQPDKDTVSAAICATFMNQKAYRAAKTVLWYCHCRSEVRTLPALSEALNSGKRVVVPYCTTDAAGNKTLGLWRLYDLSELTAGTWGILEPPRARWGEADRAVDPQELDLIMVPGVAFDQRGGRLGNGQGYYDRLLSQVRSDCVLSAVAYDCQLIDEIPMQAHDIFMHYVITEQDVYRGTGR